MKTGRPAKPEGQTRHRNKPTHGYVQMPREGRDEPVPEPVFKLLERERKLWNRLWSTPEAALWHEADAPAVTRYVKLACNPTALMDSKVLAELRNLEDRFGMSVYARRVNKLELEPEEAPAGLAEVSSLDRYQFNEAV
jgi:hypothetical protein